MLEIICIVTEDAKHEIITCIPEVVDDAEHNMVARELRSVCVYCLEHTLIKVFSLAFAPNCSKLSLRLLQTRMAHWRPPTQGVP